MATQLKKSATKPAETKKSPFGKPSNKDNVMEFVVPEETSSRIPEGKYPMRCTGVRPDTAKDSGNPMYVWDLVVAKGKYAGRDFRMWTALTPNAMWKVVETLAAFGITGKVGEKIRFSASDVKGVFVIGVVTDDVYNGRDTSRLQKLEAHPNGAGFRGTGGDAGFPAKETEEEEEPEAEEEEEEAAEDEGEEEAAEEETTEEEQDAGEDEDGVDLESMNRTELKAFIAENQLDIKVKPSMSDGQIREAIASAVEAMTQDEEPEEEPEEEEPEPVKKPASSLKKRK